MPLDGISVAEFPRLYAAESEPGRVVLWEHLLAAKTAAGQWDVEEQCVRLMVWVAAKIRPAAVARPWVNPLHMLRHGEGFCNHSAAVFVFLCHCLLGIKGRTLVMLHADGKHGHTAAEVYYRDGWHMFDPHSENAIVYRRKKRGPVLGYDDICKTPAVVSPSRHWWSAAPMGHKGFFVTGSKLLEQNKVPGCDTCDLRKGCLGATC